MNRSCRLTVLLALAGLGLAGCNGQQGLPFGWGAKKENRFTVLLMTVPGDDHVSLANHFERRTKEYTGWKDVFVVHRADHSLLFRGRYPSIDKAEPYLRQARAFQSPDSGQQVFPHAMTVPIPGQQVGPPEWNIERVPPQYYYTVLVADFFNIPKPLDPRDRLGFKPYLTRKEDAADFCKELREQNYEAYFHHGPSHSGVMIGKFDNSVVKIAQSPGKPPRRTIVSKEVHAIQKRFPHLAMNGYRVKRKIKDPKTLKIAEEYEKCRLITIPGRKPPPPETVRQPDTPTVPDRPRIFP